MSSSEAPTLPIGNRSSGKRGSNKQPGAASNRHRNSGAIGAGGGGGARKAWADFTPTPWLDYGWGGAMSPYDSTLHAGGKRDVHVDMAGGASPTPTPTSWGATPTPSGMQQNLGFMPPMLGGMPGFLAAAQYAEAAAAVAGAAAAAAVAAGQFAHASAGSEEEETPVPATSGDVSSFSDSPPWMQMYGGAPMPETINELPGGLPSAGSAAHGTGLCRPCAWFWKASGCQSGAECGYCHLCPEGELKNRKKLKVAAMRMGALQPANRSERSGARALKLTSLV